LSPWLAIVAPPRVNATKESLRRSWRTRFQFPRSLALDQSKAAQHPRDKHVSLANRSFRSPQSPRCLFHLCASDGCQIKRALSGLACRSTPHLSERGGGGESCFVARHSNSFSNSWSILELGETLGPGQSRRRCPRVPRLRGPGKTGAHAPLFWNCGGHNKFRERIFSVNFVTPDKFRNLRIAHEPLPIPHRPRKSRI
jgi:hypothetical protein